MNFAIFNKQNNDTATTTPSTATTNPAEHDTSMIQTTAFDAPQKVNLNEFGYTQAGAHGGAPAALRNLLEWIRQSRYVDENYDINARNRDKISLEKKKDELLEKEAKSIRGKEHIENVTIPSFLQDIQLNQHKITELRKQMEEGKLLSEFSWFRAITYSILTGILFVYLIFFYASVINSAFFRDFSALLSGATTDDLGLLLNSIFDAKSIFTLKAHTPFIYFGAFLFILFGMIPHIMAKKYTGWFKSAAIFGAILLTFCIEALLAYKIDKDIHNLRIMMNINEEWVFYTSERFWLVLSFGFVAYLAWGFIYEAMLEEYNKRKPDVKAIIDIEVLEKAIKDIQKTILLEKVKITDIEYELDAIKIRMEQIERQLKSAIINPQELLRNIENFYNGWLRYLNNLTERKDVLIQQSETVYEQFKNENFTTTEI